jgi:hypothetical protein
VLDDGETWFLGEDVFCINFFNTEYKPQVGPPNNRSSLPPGDNSDDQGFISIGTDCIEPEALELLGRNPVSYMEGVYHFDIDMTYVSASNLQHSPAKDTTNMSKLEIENLIATSLLMREHSLRKRCRITQPKSPDSTPPSINLPDSPPDSPKTTSGSTKSSRGSSGMSLRDLLIPPSRERSSRHRHHGASSVSSRSSGRSRASVIVDNGDGGRERSSGERRHRRREKEY